MLNSALSIYFNNILSMRYVSLFLFFLVCNDLFSDEKIKVGGLNFKIPKCMVAHTKYMVQTLTSNRDCARTTHPHGNLRPVLDSAWNRGPGTCSS